MRSLLSYCSATLFFLVCLASPCTRDARARCIPFDPGSIECSGGSVLVLPDGSGPTLESQGATITVQLWACPGEPNPLVDYPAQDMWLDDDGSGTLAFCAPGAVPDGPTDASGTTTFSQAFAGGGTTSGGLVVRTVGSEFAVPSLTIVSPDNDGDLDVDLADFAAFSLDFTRGEGTRSDLDFDGAVNIADFVLFGQAFGMHCP